MDKQSINTDESPAVRLEVHGNLNLKGWDDQVVSAKADNADDLQVIQSDTEVTVRCQSDCTVRVPRMAAVTVEVVHGNGDLKGLENDLVINLIHGNLDVRGVGDVKADKIYGNFSAKNIAGDIILGNVKGNAQVRDVQGDFLVQEKINGNLDLDDLSGDVKARADGNIALRLDPVPGQSCSLSADGNLTCRLSDEASVQVKVEHAAKIVVGLPGLEGPPPKNAPCSLTLGEGDADLILSAGGKVILNSVEMGWKHVDEFDFDIDSEFENLAETIGQQIEQQVEAQMQMMEQQLNLQMENLTARLGSLGLSEDEARRVEQRTQEASERAAARSQEKMRRAREKMERKIAAAQRRAEQRARAAEHRAQAHHAGHSWSYNWSSPPTPPSPPLPVEGEPVSEEERLMVLHLLEQKKISLEEAEQLLSALEDKEG